MCRMDERMDERMMVCNSHCWRLFPVSSCEL